MQSLLALLVVVLLALLAARLWVRVRAQRGPAPAAIPEYRLRAPLLAPRERAYLDVLQRVLGEDSIIFPNVSLAHILEFPGGNRAQRVHWFRVQRRSVDLLVCDRGLVPDLAITFSARRRGGREDPLVDGLAAVNIPLLRVRPADSYEMRDVAYRIQLARTHRDSQLSENQGVVNDESPGELQDDSRLSRLRRWTSDLWATATRAG